MKIKCCKDCVAPKVCEKHLGTKDDNLHRKDKNLSFRY